MAKYKVVKSGLEVHEGWAVQWWVYRDQNGDERYTSRQIRGGGKLMTDEEVLKSIEDLHGEPAPAR